jgi:hypothetical protein
MRVQGYAGCLEQVILGVAGEAMQDLGYGLPRIPIPRHSVNKRLIPRCSAPAVARRSRSPSAFPLQ